MQKRHLPPLHRVCPSVCTLLHHICAEQIWANPFFRPVSVNQTDTQPSQKEINRHMQNTVRLESECKHNCKDQFGWRTINAFNLGNLQIIH